MITTNGKIHIKRYLAGLVPAIGGSIAFGLGGGAEVVGDKFLGFEVDRSDITLVSYDFANNKLIFKAPVPEAYYGKIYELGLYSKTPASSESKLITTFDSATETWLTGGTAAFWASTQTRIGLDSLVHNYVSGSGANSSLTELSLDLSTNQGSDLFKFAFYTANAAVSAIRVRFLTDGANFYDFNLGAQTAGYKIVSLAKSTAVATGSPNWANIKEIQIYSTGSGADPYIEFDGIRIDDMTIDDSDYVLVSRELLATPYTKVAGMVQEVEFSLDVSV